MYVHSINYYARSESSVFENFVSMYNYRIIILFNVHRKDDQCDRPFHLSGTLNPLKLDTSHEVDKEYRVKTPYNSKL